MGIDEIQPSRRPQTVQKGRRSYLCPSSTAPAALFGSHESGLAYFVQDIHLTSAHHSHLCRVGMTDLGTAPSPDTREPTSWLARCYPRSSCHRKLYHNSESTQAPHPEAARCESPPPHPLPIHRIHHKAGWTQVDGGSVSTPLSPTTPRGHDENLQWGRDRPCPPLPFSRQAVRGDSWSPRRQPYLPTAAHVCAERRGQEGCCRKRVLEGGRTGHVRQ